MDARVDDQNSCCSLIKTTLADAAAADAAVDALTSDV